MKKLVLVLGILGMTSLPMMAQHSKEYTATDANFRTALELYEQQKYGAAQHYLEQFLAGQNEDKVSAEIDEAKYYVADINFRKRADGALETVTDYLTMHPYSNHMSRLYLMRGMLLLEGNKKSSKEALSALQKVDPKELSEEDQADLLYYEGLCYLQQKKYAEASADFKKLLANPSKYQVSAQYEYAYSEYVQNHYDEALKNFLPLENRKEYQNIVPYYITQIYYSQANYDQCVNRAETLVKNAKVSKKKNDNANLGEMYRILGEIYYDRTDYDQAITNLKKYKEVAPKVQRQDMYLLGMSLYRTEQYRECIPYLQDVTAQAEADEMSENAYLHLANCYSKLGDKNQAAAAYGEAMKTKFNKRVNEEAMYNYALASYESVDAFGKAAPALISFLNTYPNSTYAADASKKMSKVLMSTKNYREALDSLNTIKQQDATLQKTKTYLTYRLGCQNYQTHNYKGAITNLTQVVGTNNDYTTDAYYWRGEAYYMLQKYDLAAKDYTSFLGRSDVKQNANYVQANYSAGYAQFNQKAYSKALPYFNTYILSADKHQDSYADALNRIGDCYYSQRNLTQAEAYYTKAQATGLSGSDYAAYQKGYMLGLMKRYDDKIQVMEKLVKESPKSSYADDALYEIARTQLAKENDSEAIQAYQRLLNAYPNSNLARKSALEIGMLYQNNQDYDRAIAAYKRVIANYPGTEESYSALDGLEACYIEVDKVKEYIAYTKTLGRVIKTDAATREDSLTYIAAEKQYIAGNYSAASKSLDSYVKNYCSGGRYCTMAQYYLADCYYRLDKKEEALEAYKPLTEQTSNQYREIACLHAAEISYDMGEYHDALGYFEKLQTAANSMKNVYAARLGQLRCAYQIGNQQKAIKIADEIIGDAQSGTDLQKEARFVRGKAYFSQKDYNKALEDLKAVNKDLQTETGAEAKYLAAQTYFELDENTKAENEVMDFAEKNTPHQYWLARSLVLLADIYIKQGDDFQAKQYLLSIQNNYTQTDDDILKLVADRLQGIQERESETIE